jgi:hypothetical protein
MREQFDEISDSLRNGQRRQAQRQMMALPVDGPGLCFRYIATELQQPEMALDAAVAYADAVQPILAEAVRTYANAVEAQVRVSLNSGKEETKRHG